jgi:hypothetical protein
MHTCLDPLTVQKETALATRHAPNNTRLGVAINKTVKIFSSILYDEDADYDIQPSHRVQHNTMKTVTIR